MAGSLILVDEYTISSAVASVILGGGSAGTSGANVSIDNTYNVYVVQYLKVFMDTDGAKHRIRFTVSGSPDTSSNYNRCAEQLYTNQNNYTSVATDASYIESLGLGTTEPESDYGTLYLFSFSNANEFSFMTKEQIQTSSAPETAGDMGGAALQVTQACDGIQFYANTGNMASGIYRLYGLKK